MNLPLSAHFKVPVIVITCFNCLQVVVHNIRLPKQSTVGHVLDEIKTKVCLDSSDIKKPSKQCLISLLYLLIIPFLVYQTLKPLIKHLCHNDNIVCHVFLIALHSSFLNAIVVALV